MARSYKKQPFFTYCKGRKESDAFDKQQANRKFRRITKCLLKFFDDYTLFPMRLKEISDVWGWASDGPKRYRKEVSNERMRK